MSVTDAVDVFRRAIRKISEAAITTTHVVTRKKIARRSIAETTSITIQIRFDEYVG